MCQEVLCINYLSDNEFQFWRVICTRKGSLPFLLGNIVPAQDKHGNSILLFISIICNIIGDRLPEPKLKRTLGILLVRNCSFLFCNLDLKIA